MLGYVYVKAKWKNGKNKRSPLKKTFPEGSNLSFSLNQAFIITKKQ